MARLARLEGDKLVCGGTIPSHYDGVPYRRDTPLVGASEGLGTATAFLDGYAWLLIGDCRRFTFMIVSELAGVSSSSYAGYAVVTRIDGVASERFEAGPQSRQGISWEWDLALRRALRAGSGTSADRGVASALGPGGLVRVGSAEVGSNSSLTDNPDGDEIWYIYQHGYYLLRNRDGRLVAREEQLDECDWRSPACPETIVRNTCAALGNVFPAGMEVMFLQMYFERGLGMLEEAGFSARNQYFGSDAVQLPHAVYLLGRCPELFSCVSEWYAEACSRVHWENYPDPDDDLPAPGEVLGA